MRVLQLHCGYRVPAGEDAVVEAEAEMLRARGHEVSQLVVKNPTGQVAAVSNLVLSMHNPSSIRLARAAVRDFRPDVAHVHNTWFTLGASVVPALVEAGVPVVMTMHNYRMGCISADLFCDRVVCTRCVGRSSLAGVVHRCYRGSFTLSALVAAETAFHARRGTLTKGVSTFIAPSAFMGDRLIEMGLPPQKLVVKPHFIPDGGPRSQPCTSSRRVVFVGRLAPGKGVESLLRSWERLGDTDLELVLVGDGPLASELRESAPRGVQFLGWTSRSQVGELMRTARALVFPSEWYEPFGMVLLEAMAAGLPIVVNDVADAVAITQPDPRLIGSVGDDASMVRCLESVSDDGLIAAESAKMRHRYETEFTPESNAPLLEEIYRNAIELNR